MDRKLNAACFFADKPDNIFTLSDETMLGRVNEWIQNHPHVKIVSVESSNDTWHGGDAQHIVVWYHKKTKTD